MLIFIDLTHYRYELPQQLKFVCMESAMNGRSVIRSVSVFVLISLSVVFVTFFLMKKFASAEQIQPPAVDDSVEKAKSPVVAEKIEKVPEKATAKQSPKAVNPDKPKKTTGFKNNDEIKQEYGKIETVYLFSGEVYTGAVIKNDAEKYSIVTVSGVIDIPMSEVKMRNIIR